MAADLTALAVTVTPTTGDQQRLLDAFTSAGWTRRTATLPDLMSWVDLDDEQWPPHNLPPVGARRVAWDGQIATVQVVGVAGWLLLLRFRPSSVGQLLRVLAAADVLSDAVTR